MLREPFLEFWGVFIMVLMGNSVIAQMILSNKEYGSWLNICLGYGKLPFLSDSHKHTEIRADMNSA